MNIGESSISLFPSPSHNFESILMSEAVASTFADLFGPVFWGFCATLILCGVSILQGYLYFTRYNDKLPVRFLATVMLLLDFVSMGMICQSMYYYMVPYYGSLAPLSAVTRELSVECLISAVITFISQMYFVYQLHMVQTTGYRNILNILIVILGTIGLAGATGCVALMFMRPHDIFMHRNSTFVVLAGIAKGFGAAADIVATIAMCIFLKSADTGVTRTTSLLKSLMHLIVNRGLLVTFAQILLLIVFFAAPHRLYWLAVHINTTKLYVNTFFGMLNARSSLVDRYNTAHITMESFSGNQRDSPADENKKRGLGAIRITTTSAVVEI
ncbi:hypothetical protein C8R43DRAFT_991680 [Mycena crocata]|nr:hypothetical protein C8R43DRAFT_991680 [Mycena crocata]